MATDTHVAVDLVTTACDLVDRHGDQVSTHSAGVSDALLLSDELRAYSATCPDGVLGDDLAAMASELERLMAHRPDLEPVRALSG